MRRSLLTPIPEIELAGKLSGSGAYGLPAERIRLARTLIVQTNFREMAVYATNSRLG